MSTMPPMNRQLLVALLSALTAFVALLLACVFTLVHIMLPALAAPALGR